MSGRRRWKKESGNHRQRRAKNRFFRWNSTIIGGRLRARSLGAQETEASLVCNVLNWMYELGRPRSVATPR